MKRILILISMSLLTISYGWTSESNPVKKKSKEKEKNFTPEYNYPKNPHVSQEVWDKVSPYFLPSNHPAKAKLDRIFHRTRVTLNTDAVAAAGFERSINRPFSNTVVSKHPDVKGFFLKFFTDEQDIEDWPVLIWRIDGAKYVQQCIDHYGYQKFFKVPKKWIYPLPADPSPPAGMHRKNFILVAEEMDIYHKSKNYSKWKHNITIDRADAIYTVLQIVGLKDSIYAFNIPFCKDGTQAFIDTEHHHEWPIRFDLMLPWFNPRMEQYWRVIVGHGGPLPEEEKKKWK